MGRGEADESVASQEEAESIRAAPLRMGRRSPTFLLSCLLALVALLSGCTGLPGFPSQRVSFEEQSAYDAALARLPADARGAGQGLEDFLDRYPRSALADDAMEQLAKLSFADGRQDDGAAWLETLLRRYPTSDRAASARLRLARLEYARDQRLAARGLLGELDFDRLSTTEQLEALRLRIDLARTPVERLERMSALRAALEAEGERVVDDRSASQRLRGRLDALDREIDAFVGGAASAELDETMRRLKGRTPAPRIALELCRRALDTGQLTLAERRLARTESLVRTDAQRAELDFLRNRYDQLVARAATEADLPPLRELEGRGRLHTEDARGTVGVVLPLSGDFAAYGESSLRGILLATDLFSKREGFDDGGFGPSEVRLVVRDSEGDPKRAAEAVRTLASDPDVMAILGPIFSAESVAAADEAELMGVPLVTLSTRQDVPDGRSQAFRTRTTPDDEVGVLVAHAFDELAAERFAVLYPRTRYGRGMRKLYWEAIRERGGKLVAAASYDPETVDFSSAIRDMIGFRFLTPLEKRAVAARESLLRSARRLEGRDAARLRRAAFAMLGPEGEPLPPIVDFDVLFIPDAADKIALIAPGLAFQEIRGVRLLGSNDWLDEELPRVGRQHVSGAIISTPFYPDSDVSFVTEFVEGFRGTFAEEPDAYAAEAFDAANLVLVQLSAGRSSRVDVRDGLLDMRAVPGATGVLTMQASGNARRRPFLLQISGRRFEPLD